MIGLPLSESTRAAALDGALSFSILLQNQRELTLDTAQSSVTGLLSAIQSAPADYARLLETAQTTGAAQADAANRLAQPEWTEAPTATRDAIRDTLNDELAALVASARADATTATAQAASAKTDSTNPSSEYTYAAATEDAGNLLLTALDQLEAGDAALAAATFDTARAQAVAARDGAVAHLAALSAQNPPSSERIADTNAVLAAANAVLAAIDEGEAAIESPLASAAGETPTTFQLTTGTAVETYLTVWGDSGAIALTDANGQGILIRHDGSVDSIPPSGDGWQFQNDSTFLLPDGTKISFSPGTPATVLATRGQQQIAITNLQPGEAPSASRQVTGGIAADAARNDGHIFVMGADQRSWTLSGASLGQVPGTRETVATTPIENEQVVDVTNVTLPTALLDQLKALGIDPASFDTNADGLFSNGELQKLVQALDSAIGGAQARFDSALTRTSAALDSLQQLNRFIEKVLAESERRQADREQVTAEQRDQLLQIQRDLNAAQRGLRSAESLTPGGTSAPNVLTAAQLVLKRLDSFGGDALRPTTPPTSSIPERDAASSLPTPPTSDEPPAALAQAFRRAERVLSGLGGGNPVLRFAEPPANPATNTTPVPGTVNLPVTPPIESTGFGAAPLFPSSLPTADSAPEISSVSDLLRRSQASVTDLGGGSVGPRFAESPPGQRDVVSSALNTSGASQVELPLPAPRPALDRETGVAPQISNSVSSTDPKPATSPKPNALSRAEELDEPTAGPRVSGFPLPPPTNAAITPPTVPPQPTAPAADEAVQRSSTEPRASGPEATPGAFDVQQAPRPPSGQAPLRGTGFPETGPDSRVAPDPTFGGSDGFAHEFRRRLDHHLATHRDHVTRAQQVQSTVRQVVEHFVTLVSQDEQLRQVFQTDDLSAAQRDALKGKVEALERDLGLTWGGDPAKTPQGEASLHARALASGMMI